MKKLLLLSAVCLCATSGYALDVKPYVEGKISHNWMKAAYSEENFETNFKDHSIWGGSLEIGTKLDQFRIGLEGYYNDDMKDKFFNLIPVKGETKGVFLNGYFDIPLPDLKQIKPYVGAGIGYSWLKETLDATSFDLGKTSAKDHSLSWNAGLGLGYALNDNIDLTLGYRYEYLGEIKEYDSKTKFKNNKVSLGLRYTF